MSRYRVPGLPPGIVVLVGWDRALGFWCEVRRSGEPCTTYDATTAEGGITSIHGVLNTLIEAGVVAREDVADAKAWLAEDDVEDIPVQHVGLRVAGEVIAHLREAAG